MLRTELRPATPEDAHIVLSWRNDPFIIARSTSQEAVSREAHERWFSDSLENPDRLLFIIMIDTEAAGLVRFDRIDPEFALISVYLCETFTGQGQGIRGIIDGAKAALQCWDVQKFVAYVRNDNAAARKAFAKAGYHLVDRDSGCPADHVCFHLEASEAVSN